MDISDAPLTAHVFRSGYVVPLEYMNSTTSRIREYGQEMVNMILVCLSGQINIIHKCGHVLWKYSLAWRIDRCLHTCRVACSCIR